MGSSCRGAEAILSYRFRREPALRKTLRSEAAVYAFFAILASSARRGFPRIVCVHRGSKVVAVALYVPPGRPSIAQLARLAGILALLSPRSLLAATAWAARSGAYVRTLSVFKPRCHLLFIASAVSGRGYGSAALELVETLCAGEGGFWVTLEVLRENPALLFYAKRGYRPVAATVYAGSLYVAMCKRLRATERILSPST